MAKQKREVSPSLVKYGDVPSKTGNVLADLDIEDMQQRRDD